MVGHYLLGETVICKCPPVGETMETVPSYTMGEQVGEYVPRFALRAEKPGVNLTVMSPVGYHLEHYIAPGLVICHASGANVYREGDHVDVRAIGEVVILLPTGMEHSNSTY
jgi:hypothetical protein